MKERATLLVKTKTDLLIVQCKAFVDSAWTKNVLCVFCGFQGHLGNENDGKPLWLVRMFLN